MNEQISELFADLQGKVYLDNASETLIPKTVGDTMNAMNERISLMERKRFSTKLIPSDENSEIRRSIQESVKSFIGASNLEEIAFSQSIESTTEILARALSELHFKEDDEIVMTAMEQDCCIKPWKDHLLKKRIRFRVIPVDSRGVLEWKSWGRVVGKKTKLALLTHVSHVTGAINPLKHLISLFKSRGIPVLVDGSQAVPHFKVDVQNLGCDFYLFSGKNMYGPSDISVLYAKREWMELISSWIKNNHKIALPDHNNLIKPGLSSIVGLGAAIDFLKHYCHVSVENLQISVRNDSMEILGGLVGIKIKSPAVNCTPIFSFHFDKKCPLEIAALLQQNGITVRAGDCDSELLMKNWGISGIVRISPAFYNSGSEISKVFDVLSRTFNRHD